MITVNRKRQTGVFEIFSRFDVRSIHRGCSIKKDILKNFAKLTGKHLCLFRFFFFKFCSYVSLIMWKWYCLKKKKKMQKLSDREFLWLICSIICEVIHAVFTLGGTIFDLISSNMLPACDWRNLLVDNGV